MQDERLGSPNIYGEDVGGSPASSINIFAILAAVLRRWKLIAAITLVALVATHAALKLVPSRYKSTVEILISDPQRQFNATVQKPISPFVDAISSDSINTEIKVLKSKSVALRVAKELHLDEDPEFQSHGRPANLAEWLGFPSLGRTDNDNAKTTDSTKEEAERLDKAADALRASLDVSSESYIITVSATSTNLIKAQLLASTVANDYLASQRETRQEALQRIATWLKGRLDDLQSQLSKTESSIEKLKVEIGIRDIGSNSFSEKQISELNTQLMNARAEVDEKRARIDQARHVIDIQGDMQSIPELTASSVLTELRQRQTQLSGLAANLKNKVGERHAQVIAIQDQLAGVNRQMNAEAEHILGNMKNAYDIAVRREQLLEANFRERTSTRGNSETYIRLQQLQRVADTTRDLYNSYLSQYNETVQRITLQDTNARIISPATLPTSPASPRRMLLYGLGGILGLGSGSLLALLLEYFRSGIRTEEEIERSFNLPVLGVIPLAEIPKGQGIFYKHRSHRTIAETKLNFIEAVHAVRINLALWSANPKVVLVTSALPGEGKSTVSMLLAISSANSGKKTLLLDCDFRHSTVSETFQDKSRPGLSELLRGTVRLADVVTKDVLTENAYIIPAGSMIPNSADLLMSQGMRDLIAELREKFDYIVIDTAPLLPVIDALAAATTADKVLLVIEWNRTSRASVSETLNVLRPEVHRVAGLILNKVDFKQLQGYGYRGYNHPAADKYFSNAARTGAQKEIDPVRIDPV